MRAFLPEDWFSGTRHGQRQPKQFLQHNGTARVGALIVESETYVNPSSNVLLLRCKWSPNIDWVKWHSQNLYN
jgi:hypothetical protein